MSNATSHGRPLRPIFIVFAFGLILLAIPYLRPDYVPVFFLFIGRLHPLLLHFPIVLIMLALILELSRRRLFPSIGDMIVQIVLIAAALSAVGSIVAGFFLYSSGEYSGDVIERHLWAGVITGSGIFMSLTAFMLYRRGVRIYPLYIALLVASNISLIYTSHLGGSVTHGEAYLSEHLALMMADSTTIVQKEEAQLLVYADMVAPVFESRCVSCHNDLRAKGGLVMGNYQQLFKAGDSDNPGVVRGSIVSSEISKRILLPMDHDDHMPPEGKAPMTDDEISLLNFWIAQGASDTLKVTAAKQTDSIAFTIDRLIPALHRYRIKSSIASLRKKEVHIELEKLSQQLHLSFKRDSLSDGDLYMMAMTFPPITVGSDHFHELSTLFDNFSKVSLTSAGLQDEALYYIGQMKNVRELFLQKNALQGSGLIYLKELQQLEVLNLSFNRIDDKSVLDLLMIPNLKTVYLYRTNTSPQVIEALKKNRPGLNVLLEEGPYL